MGRDKLANEMMTFFQTKLVDFFIQLCENILNSIDAGMTRQTERMMLYEANIWECLNRSRAEYQENKSITEEDSDEEFMSSESDSVESKGKD